MPKNNFSAAGLLVTLAITLAIALSLYSITKNDRESPADTGSPFPAPSSEIKAPAPAKEKISNLKIEDVVFPENFFFGTASSDFQTTGGTGRTDWNLYIQNCIRVPKNCVRDDPLNNSANATFVGPGTGTDFLNRYKEDFDLASGKTQVHRISLEWARIEPEEGKWDMSVIQKYKEIFAYMQEKGIEPMICLNHFALPLWFVEKGGWESHDFPLYYSRYAEKIAYEIGLPLNIKWWLTFNEPQVILGQSYVKGSWPPHKSITTFQDMNGTRRLALVTNNAMEAHRQSYRAIHRIMDKKTKVMVGLASAPGAFYPNDPNSELDMTAVNSMNFISTLMFDYMLGTSDRDFIGLNYYGRSLLKLHASLAYQVKSWLNEERPFAVEWVPQMQNMLYQRPKEFYPNGLYDLIMQFKDLGLPIIITENGIHSTDDKFREEYIVIHLKAVHNAIRDGADVRGYQYWALTDTWEWNGFFSQMGLLGIDHQDNKQRILRPSALTYGEIIRTKILTIELQEKYKEFLPN